MDQQFERELTMIRYNCMRKWRFGEVKQLFRCDLCTKQLLLSRKSDGGLVCIFLEFWYYIWKDKMKRIFFLSVFTGPRTEGCGLG